MKAFFLRLSTLFFRWAVSAGSGLWAGLQAEIGRLDTMMVDTGELTGTGVLAGTKRPLTAEEKHSHADAWLRTQAPLSEPVRRRIIQAAVMYRRLAPKL